MKKIFLISLTIAGASFLYQGANAQDGSAKPTEKEEENKMVRFNGLGRTNLSQTNLGGDVLNTDTTTARGLTDGEFLLDLQINATPNDKTEVQSILRLRNEFGGFFGAGITVEVRELWARGIIANALKYRVGDMDKKMTPYTLFLAEEEGVINEPAAFMPQKELIYYEQFYTGDNTRRLQGANFDFGLTFNKGLRDMDVSGFAARIRGTDFFTTPSRFISGAQIHFRTERLIESTQTMAEFGFNTAYTFDDLMSGQANTGIRNTVYTGSYNVTAYENDKISVNVLGEAGFAAIESKNDSTSLFKRDDSFLDIGVKALLKEQKLSVQASFIDIGPDFFSVGAQSKRVEFNAAQTFYNRIGNEGILRAPSLFDLSRDRAMYTFRISDVLMAYDPRFNNTMPFGLATPNRRGLRSNIEYGNEGDAVNAGLEAALLSEIRGQGTTELKNFTMLRARTNINVNQFIDWEKRIRVTVGYQFEETSRDGVEIEQVQLRSNLLEFGLETEIFEDFDILLGAKGLNARGTEYIPEILQFNEVNDFPGRTRFSDQENMYAAGVKYTFKEGIHLTIQYQTFDSRMGMDNPFDYALDQIFALYTMNF